MEAITAFRKAIEVKPDYADALNNLGAVLFRQGKLVEAEAAFRRAIELKPGLADAHSNLGAALFAHGKLSEAVTALQKAIELKPEHAAAHRILGVAQQMARFDGRLPAVLDGTDKPKDAAERLGFASLCQGHHKRFAAAARFYEEALVEQPALAAALQFGHRYNAACAAALAGCGQGKDAADLKDLERARLRKQALNWLRADLDAWNELLKKNPDKVRPVIIQTMQHWQADTDFAGVRGTQALSKLPEAERPAWQKLWANVTDTLARAQAKSATSAKPEANSRRVR